MKYIFKISLHTSEYKPRQLELERPRTLRERKHNKVNSTFTTLQAQSICWILNCTVVSQETKKAKKKELPRGDIVNRLFSSVTVLGKHNLSLRIPYRVIRSKWDNEGKPYRRRRQCAYLRVWRVRGRRPVP